MRNTSLLASLLSVVLSASSLMSLSACPAGNPGEGEGEAGEGEGEGEAGEGEGEGEAGEGEGEGEAGEGEGEGDIGEGEGEEPATCGAGLPTPSASCIADSCGNDIGVGQPCTKDGGECERYGFGEAGICTADHDETELLFCTKFCVSDDDCGDDAKCTVDPENPVLGRGCVRNACI